MKAILLAAGMGTRLKPLTDATPKCLAPIRDRPLLDIWLDNLTRAGLGPFLVNTHHLSGAVSKFVSHSPYRDSVTLVHEPELLGTGGTMLANRAFFGTDPVFVAHADNLCVCDFAAFVEAHNERPPEAQMTMMTFRTSTPASCGIVELDQRRIVTAFHEKVADPPGDLANGAVYIMEPGVVDWMAGLGKAVVDVSTEVLPHFLGRINTWHNAGVHRDIGTMESWRAAQVEML